mmetsp:Transcript_54176/g.167966  ORF Transcript_54176/g.167966 Transcript_54176/m.167966 type:complete len:245 (-) Transcript_54176:176-910(-)
MMHSTRLPGIIALTPELSRPRMLWLTMSAPASPKPRASKEPSLMIVFSRMRVSMVSLPLEDGKFASTKRCQRSSHWLKNLLRLVFSLASRYLMTSSSSNSASAIFRAISGSFAIVFTFCTILSTGLSTRVLASLEKKSVLMQRTTQMKKVAISASMDSSRVKGLLSKKKTKCQSSNWTLVSSCGCTRMDSAGRRSDGHLASWPTEPSISVLSMETPKWSTPPKLQSVPHGEARRASTSGGILPV